MTFIGENFLLKTETAKRLFFDYAKDTQIFDFHCHISPKEIYENKKFADITEAWLSADHYKWRAMRTMGIDEKYITGNANSFEKFKAYAKTIQYAPGNPLYHWTHLELQRYFNIYTPLTEDLAKQIYDKVNEKLSTDDFTVRELIRKSNVKIIYTTDDPLDDLKYHQLLKKETEFETKVLPAFRPDKIINIEIEGFHSYIKDLSKISNIDIDNIHNLKKAIAERINYFDAVGCKASDHGVTEVPFEKFTETEVETIFKNVLMGRSIKKVEIDKYKTCILQFLAEEYTKKNWVMEIHIGILRNINEKAFKKLGPDSGFDSIADYQMASKLSKLLSSFEENESLPKTILFCSRTSDNSILATIAGAFQSAESVSKVQLGTAWWFQDNIKGMKEQILSYGNLLILGKFVGMLTDSRSFLSYPRHEYFRRILCSILGEWIEDGMYHNDLKFVGTLIKDICYNNALSFFNETNP